MIAFPGKIVNHEPERNLKAIFQISFRLVRYDVFSPSGYTSGRMRLCMLRGIAQNELGVRMKWIR